MWKHWCEYFFPTKRSLRRLGSKLPSTCWLPATSRIRETEPSICQKVISISATEIWPSSNTFRKILWKKIGDGSSSPTMIQCWASRKWWTCCNVTTNSRMNLYRWARDTGTLFPVRILADTIFYPVEAVSSSTEKSLSNSIPDALVLIQIRWIEWTTFTWVPVLTI